MIKLTKNNLLIFFTVGLIIKVGLLFWSAHPYDFWTFVTSIQKNTLYGWNIFEGWNKGNILFLLWYPSYSLYLIIVEFFNLPIDNIPLLHFFFKAPFLFIDVVCGFLLYKIVSTQHNSGRGRLAFIIWFINPIVFYVYGVHGHYELLVSLAILLMLYGVLRNNFWLISLGTIIGFSTKYITIILFPFIILYLLSLKKYKTALWTALCSALGIALSYTHFIFTPELAKQTAHSIVSLVGANAPTGIKVLNLSPLNIFSAKLKKFLTSISRLSS